MPNYPNLAQRLKESCRSEHQRFMQSLVDVKEVQRRKLLKIVKANTDTEIGRRFGFGKIKSVEDFRAGTPVTTYEDYEEYVSRIADGEERVLTADKVIMLEPTSGSTSPSKFIPYTDGLKEDFQAGIFPWLFDLIENSPGLGKGCFYWSVTPVAHSIEQTNGGIPIGFGDDGAYFTDEQRRLVAQLSAVPFSVAQIQDIDNFRDGTVSYLLGNKDLSFISVWNPTFLSLLLRPFENNPERLLGLVADRQRRQELERILGESEDKGERYARIWPNLSLISSWTEGNAAHYVHEITNRFPKSRLQGKGLIATEGFVSLPLVGEEGAVLAANSHFFEFQDVDSGEIKMAHEVKEGRRYGLVLTTSGGFYRYNLQDIVEVTGFKAECPRLRFIGRNNQVSDLFGEKLNEYHVSKVIRKTFDRFGVKPGFFMVAPETSEMNGNAYTLFMESDQGIDNPDGVVAGLDGGLQENYHYRYCRKLGQLERPRIFLIDGRRESASDVYLRENQKTGKKIGNVKPPVLDSKIGWSRRFLGRFIN